MLRFTAFFALLFFIGPFALTARALTKYWDIETISHVGAGGLAPSGTWNTGGVANWNIRDCISPPPLGLRTTTITLPHRLNHCVSH